MSVDYSGITKAIKGDGQTTCAGYTWAYNKTPAFASNRNANAKDNRRLTPTADALTTANKEEIE